MELRKKVQDHRSQIGEKECWDLASLRCKGCIAWEPAFVCEAFLFLSDLSWFFPLFFLLYFSFFLSKIDELMTCITELNTEKRALKNQISEDHGIATMKVRCSPVGPGGESKHTSK
jgi:hypothetical protein